MSSKPNTSVEANDQYYGYDSNFINHEEKRNVRDDKLLPPLMNAIERKKQVEYLISDLVTARSGILQQVLCYLQSLLSEHLNLV